MPRVVPPEPESLAIFPSLNERSFSADPKPPGGIYQFECEVFVGQTQNSWQFLPIWMRGVFRSEPKFLAVSPSLNAEYSSVRTNVPISFFQFKFEVRLGPNRNSWQNQKSWLHLAVWTSLNARRFSGRTKRPGDISQFECEAFFGQNRNSWRYFAFCMPGAFRSEQERLVIFTDLDARRLSVRTQIPGNIYECAREAFFGRNQNSWPYLPI